LSGKQLQDVHAYRMPNGPSASVLL
jgi:hypothetical protein